jgi:hypothetical protein
MHWRCEEKHGTHMHSQREEMEDTHTHWRREEREDTCVHVGGEQLSGVLLVAVTIHHLVKHLPQQGYVRHPQALEDCHEQQRRRAGQRQELGVAQQHGEKEHNGQKVVPLLLLVVCCCCRKQRGGRIQGESQGGQNAVDVALLVSVYGHEGMSSWHIRMGKSAS